jgi:hypothetical protein
MTVYLTVIMCNCMQPIDPGQVGLPEELPQELLTPDLLQAYKAPVDCYLRHKLWGHVGASENELLSASFLLEGMIEVKTRDPLAPLDMGKLVLVQNLVNKIMQKGICL